MALLTVQDFTTGSIANFTTAAANAGGDTVAAGTISGGWELATYLLVLNTDVAARTVTVTMPNGSVIGPVNVAATTGRSLIKVMGVSPGQIASIAYSAATGVTVAAFRTWYPS